MKTKLLKLTSFILALILTLSVAGAAVFAEKDADIVEGGSFVVAIQSEPGAYIPSFGNPNEGYIVVQNIMNKLVKLNVDNEVVPDLAESWEFSEDGKTLTFHLHKGVKWHDGVDFSAEDVVFTFKKAIEVKGFASGFLSKLVEINAPDENTVELVLPEPDVSILGRLAWMGTYIMPKHLYEEGDVLENPTNQSPIGTGPFKFVEQVPGESITIERNDDFFGEKAHLNKVIFRVIPDQMAAHQAWLAGEVDDNRLGVPAAEMDKVKEMDGVINFPMDFPNMAGILFNVEEGIFTDVRLREAIAYAIDAQDLLTRVYKDEGTVAKYFIPYQFAWAINEEATQPAHDPEKAMELIEEAGYEKDADGFYFTVTVDTYPGWDNFVPVLKAQLEKCGIKLEHNSMDDPSYDAKILDDFDFEMTLLGGYIGPDVSAIDAKFSTGGGMNYGHYSRKEVDDLLAAGLKETDQEKRAEIYKEVQTYLREDLPMVFFRNFGYTGFLKDYIKGHPSTEARKTSSEYELTSVWLAPQDK